MDKYHSHLHLIKHLHLKRFIHDQFNDLVLADVFRNLAISMIALFIPLYLLNNNFSLRQVVVLEFGMYVASIIFHYYILKYISSLGVKRTLVVSYILQVVFYFSLFYSASFVREINPTIFLFAIGFLNILPAILYWSAHHLYFIETTEKKEEGAKLGLLTGIPVLFSISSPFVGSYVIVNFGYSAIFFVSGLLILIGASMLSQSGRVMVVSNNLSWSKILDFKRNRKNIIFIIQGISTCSTSFLWPIALFLFSIKLLAIGGLYLVSNLINSFFVYFSGKRIDRSGNQRMSKIGAAGYGLSLILRSLSETIIALTAYTSMGGAFGGMFNLSIDSGFFKKSHDDAINAIMNREFYMHIGRMMVVLSLLALLAFYPIKFALVLTLFMSGVFVFASIGVINEEILVK